MLKPKLPLTETITEVSSGPDGPGPHKPEVPEYQKPTRERVRGALKDGNDAISLDLWAGHLAESGDYTGASLTRGDAKRARERSEKGLNRWYYTSRNIQPRGNGGELVPLLEPENPSARGYKVALVEERVGVLEHQASSEAMDLVSGVDCLPLALELANSVKAKNRIERLLCHQMAIMHTLGATMAGRAKAEADNIKSDWMRRHTEQFQAACVEANRLNNSAARAFSSFQDAALALQRLRTGGKQVVRVIHQQVQVNEGGKAVVAGNLKNARKAGGSKRRGSKSKS
jgi:hypothetical protein